MNVLHGARGSRWLAACGLAVCALFSLPAWPAGSVAGAAVVPTALSEEQMQLALMRQAQVMAVMFDLRKSRLGFDETVNAIKQGAEKRNWKLGPVQDVQAQMIQAGVKDAPRLKVVPTCPADADARIARAGQGRVPPLPCRITVFIDKDSHTQIVKLNTGNLARAAKGELAKTLAEITQEEDALLKGIAAE